MASQLNASGATVVTEDGTEHTNAQIVVRLNEANLDGNVKTGVRAIRNMSAARSVVFFEDGTSWTVKRAARKGGCGCR